MRKIYLFDIGLLVVAGTVAGVLADEPVHPAKPSQADIVGEAVNCSDMPEHADGCSEIRAIDSGDGATSSYETMREEGT